MTVRRRNRSHRTCKICSEKVQQNVAAHPCPHGAPCRYRLRPDGSVMDWETPECEICKTSSTRLRLVLSDKAHEMLG